MRNKMDTTKPFDYIVDEKDDLYFKIIISGFYIIKLIISFRIGDGKG